MTTIPTGVARVFGATARGMVLDAAAGVCRGIEYVADRKAGRSRALSTLRVRALILSDDRGTPLAVPDQLSAAFDRADRIFTDAAGLRVRLVGVDVVTEPAPVEVLDPRSNRRLLLDHIRGRTEFFRRELAPRPLLSIVGDPVTVVVVRNIAGTVTGCSLGMTADWVLAQASLFEAANPRGYDETVLAHELGHALNLPHVRDQANLMNPVSTPPNAVRGTSLRPWQAAIVAANRHVIPPA
ncbi:MAG: hypothetical protein ABI382_02915 [Nakamurella sp.]